MLGTTKFEGIKKITKKMLEKSIWQKNVVNPIFLMENKNSLPDLGINCFLPEFFLNW